MGEAGDTQALRLYAQRLTDQHEVTRIIRLLVDKARESSTRHRTADLVAVLAWHNRVDELRPLADAGDELATERLVEWLNDRGRFTEAETLLRNRFLAGDSGSPKRLVDFLAERADVNGLVAFVRQGDGHAAQRLAEVGSATDRDWLGNVGALVRRPFWTLPR